MARKKILHIFCSKEDALMIRAKLRCTPNTQLNLTASKGKLSSKSIVSRLKKNKKFQSGDYVFFIDACNIVVFQNDQTSEFILPFKSAEEFLNWFSNESMKGCGYIDCKKKH